MRGKKKMTEKTYEKTNGIFIGKELAGQSKDTTKPWKRYKAKFKRTMESEKPFSFTCFGGLNVDKTKYQLEELEDGKQYGVRYASEMRTNKNDQEYESKTVIGFQDVYPPESLSNNSAAAQPVAASGVKLEGFPDFAKKYFDTCKTNSKTPSAVHMLGSYVATNESVRVADLITACKKAIVDAETDTQVVEVPKDVQV